MTKRERLDALMVLGGFSTKVQFCKRLGIAPNTLSNWYYRDTFDIEVVYEAFPEVSPDWLITGKGPMLRGEVSESLARLLEKEKRDTP